MRIRWLDGGVLFRARFVGDPFPTFRAPDSEVGASLHDSLWFPNLNGSGNHSVQ